MARFAGNQAKINQWKAYLRKNPFDVEIDLTEVVQ